MKRLLGAQVAVAAVAVLTALIAVPAQARPQDCNSRDPWDPPAASCCPGGSQLQAWLGFYGYPAFICLFRDTDWMAYPCWSPPDPNPFGPDGVLSPWGCEVTASGGGGGGPPPEPSPWDLAPRALPNIPTRTPQVNPRGQVDATGPPGTLVNLPVWFWLDPAQWTPIVGAPLCSPSGRTCVTVTATPQQINAYPADGGRAKACPPDNPGQAWRDGLDAKAETPCSYKYPRPSKSAQGKVYGLYFQITWRVTWTTTRGSPGTLPDETRRSADVPIAVYENESLIQ